MNKHDNKFDRMLVVRITTEQYTRLLERIILERKKGVKSSVNNSDKSKFIREIITKYTANPS